MCTVVSLQAMCVCVCVCSLLCLWGWSNHAKWNITGKYKKHTVHLNLGPAVLVCAVTEWNWSFTLCQAELQKLRQQALETKHFIEKQEAEERKLLRIIAEADGERLRQKKELDQVRTSPHQTCRPYQQTQLFDATLHKASFFSKLFPSVYQKNSPRGPPSVD